MFLASAAWAQSSLVSGGLDGSVADSSVRRIPGAAVTVRETATNRMREAPTNADGTFHIAELPVGTYEVLVNQPGFASYRHTGVTIPLGSTVHLDIVLQAAGLTTQVTVTAQPPRTLRSAIDLPDGIERNQYV
jgi:hypothetical protein